MKTPTLKALALVLTTACLSTAFIAQQTTAQQTEAPEATVPETSAPDPQAPAATLEGGAEATPAPDAAPAETAPAEAAPAEAAPADDAAPADAAPAEDAAPAGDAAPANDPNAAPEAGADASAPQPADDATAPATGDAAAPADATAPAADANAAADPAEGGTESATQPARTGAEIIGDLPIIGQPQPGGIGFQPAATSLAAEIHWLDAFLLVMITIIALFVTGLIGWVVFRYARARNPEPARFTHNSPLEVTWTIVPILILVSIGAFSLPVLFDQQRIPEGDVVVKVTGYQWYWSYEYPEEEGVEFSSYMVGADAGNMLTADVSEQLQNAGYTDDQFRLATDTAIVVPVGKTIVMQVTGGDVIHSWTIPAFGVKQDGIPGRLAQLWFRPEAEGIYFGQCSELCGIAHAYMPITVKVVSEERYAEWLDAVKAGEIESW